MVPVRILHVTDCYRPMMGGIETQVSHLAAHQARDHEVAVFTTTAAHPGAHGRSREQHDDVDVYRVAARMPLGIPVHPCAPRHLRDLIGRLDPDVVHFHMGGTAPSVQSSLRAASGRPTVLTIHSVWTPAVVGSYRALSALTGFASWGIQMSTVSGMCARRVEAGVGTPVMVVGNGIDVDQWRAPALPHDGVHVVSATRFAPRKRIGAMLRMLRDAHDELGSGAGLRATIAGDGPELARARAWVDHHGLGSWLHLPGRMDRGGLQRLYREADVYLAPVVLEAFSIAVLEAQCAGLAILCRTQSGAAERLTDGVDGLLAPDDAALTAGLVRLVRDRQLLARITAHNRTTVPPYDWDTVMAQTEEVYRAAGGLAD